MTMRTIRTTDATPTVLATFTPEGTDDCFLNRTFRVLGISFGANRASYLVTAAAKRASGVISLVGSPSIVAFEDDAAWACTVDVSGVLRIVVTGAAATIVDWYYLGAESGGSWPFNATGSSAIHWPPDP